MLDSKARHRPFISNAVLIYCDWRRLQGHYEWAEKLGKETSELDQMEAEILDRAAAERHTSDFDRAMLQVIAFECGDGDLQYETYRKLRRLADDFIDAVAKEIDGYSARSSGNWAYFVTKWDNISYLG